MTEQDDMDHDGAAPTDGPSYEQLVANGTLTPNVVNRDNKWLEPVGSFIGHVSEVNGPGGEEIDGFLPTRHELGLVVKHWMMQIIEYEFFIFCFQCASSELTRRSSFAARRVERIEMLIGEEDTHRAIENAYAEFGRAQNAETWRIFRNGTKEEVRAFHATLTS